MKTTLAVLGLISFLSITPLDDESSSSFTMSSRVNPLFLQSTFRDVPASHPDFAAIEYAYEHGIVRGYSDGTFRPDASVNRAEFVVILVSTLFPREIVAACLTTAPRTEWFAPTLIFADVAKHFWYAPALCTARLKQLVDGYPDRTFRPARSISIAEAAKILSAAFRIPLPSGEADSWYVRPIAALASRGSLPLTILRPDSPLTRAQFVNIVYRIRENITDLPARSARDLLGPSVDRLQMSSSVSEKR